MRAYVLVNATPGRSLELARRVLDVQGVRAANAITGEYDVVVICESPDINALGTLIVDGIQRLDTASTRRQPVLSSPDSPARARTARGSTPRSGEGGPWLRSGGLGVHVASDLLPLVLMVLVPRGLAASLR